MIEFDDRPSQIGTNIKVIGVGGAGGNAINTMIKNGLQGVEFIAANTDADDLTKSLANMKLQLGKKLTRGLGTGANPELGSRSAEESKDDIKANLEGADMVFIAAGMGGGTGTGAAPIIAKIAREMGILTLGIVTIPFNFEGRKRKENAGHGIRHLKEFVDTLIAIPNEKLTEIYGKAPLTDAFNHGDDVLYQAAKAVSDIINITGLINVDFADVRAVMQNMGYALMGSGMAGGEDRAINAARAAIDNPLLADISLAGCQALLLNVTAGPDILMEEYEQISNVIVNETGMGANIIMGVILDEEMIGKISVTIIATGLTGREAEEPQKIMDFPTAAVAKKESVEPAFSQKDEIKDILSRLNVNDSVSEGAKAQTGTDDNNRINQIKTEPPSFLKALD